ncbi:hypothetical protein FSP39_016470 [Pinctada imbricata]|uniref:G-protein coupled receptors family 1 profile domain-containing protein n=1 Tax=Pinctada imbricata TaxID=66713 RepID=A0AA88XLT3_PINIB|nr:hypothetical protein FSP39_016470 [Pinctada imbricata]
MMKSLTECVITLLVTVGIITSNTLIFLVIVWTDSLRNINKIYFCSLTVADLCIGLFITPFAVISSFGEDSIHFDVVFCHFEAYFLVVFFIAGIYSLAWISVDHYLFIRKPQRHKVAMTTARSLCWIAFVWIAAISFCSPPLFSFDRATYYEDVCLCSIFAGPQKPYFVTAGLLVLLPAIVALTVTNGYLFTSKFRKTRHMYETVLLDTASRPKNYFMNFIVTMVLVISWIPWLVLQIYGVLIEEITDFPHSIHFYLLWFGIGSSFYKFFVYLWSQDFRRGLKQLCGHSECRCPDCVPNRGTALITLNGAK